MTDPVCGTLAMFLSTPVVFCCSNVGLLPFKNASMAVYPYGQMTAEQRALLMEYVAFAREAGVGVASTQMGGGCVLALRRAGAGPRQLGVVEVLSVFLRAVLASEAYANAEARLSICNIVLQRLGALVTISREHLRCVYEDVLAPARAEAGSSPVPSVEKVSSPAETGGAGVAFVGGGHGDGGTELTAGG